MRHYTVLVFFFLAYFTLYNRLQLLSSLAAAELQPDSRAPGLIRVQEDSWPLALPCPAPQAYWLPTVTSPWVHSPCWSLLSAPALNVIFPLNCSARTDALAISYLARLEWSQSVQFSSVAQSCPTVCDPMNRSTPGLPAHHQLPKFTQTHVHRVSDAIQPSHPLSSPSPPAPNSSQQQSLFQ